MSQKKQILGLFLINMTLSLSPGIRFRTDLLDFNKTLFKFVSNHTPMKASLCFPFVLLLNSLGYSQVVFEQGYLIKINGDSIPCLIKNPDWKKNPQQYEYKLTNEDQIQTGDMENTSAFGIGREVKFVTKEVDVDVSNDQIEDLDLERAPRFTRKKVFLRVLLEGRGSLHELDTRENIRFYILAENGQLVPLVYKAYQVPGKGVAYNYTYRSQLNKEMACGSSAASIQDLKYDRTELMNYVREYNTCIGSGTVEYEKQARPLRFSVRVFTGINFYSVLINNRTDPKIGLKVGAELEAILPISKSKMAVFLAPAYQAFRSDPVEFSLQTATLDYKGLELPVGFRHYLFLNTRSKLFFEGMFVVDIPFANKIDFSSREDINNSNSFTYAFGSGLMINRWSIQGRWYGARKFNDVELLQGTLGFRKISVFLGYRLF